MCIICIISYFSQKEFTKYMYDYLKSESLVPKVDVRYFTEIKKVLRNGFRRITERNIVKYFFFMFYIYLFFLTSRRTE